DIKSGETSHLESAVRGGARILWKESGIGVKWAVVRIGNCCEPPQKIVEFVLDEDLCIGDTASATVSDSYGLGEEDAEITVADPYDTPGMFVARAGYRGIAIAKVDECGDPDDEWQILYIEHQARLIEFTAYETPTDIGGGVLSGEVTLDAWRNGKEPDTDENGRLTIFFCPELHPNVRKDCKGVAYWQESTNCPDGDYHAISCDQQVNFLICELDESMTNTDAEVDLTPGTFTQLSWAPFGTMPQTEDLPTIAKNDLSLAGTAGDKAIIQFRDIDQQWVVVQVAHHKVRPLTSVFFDAGECKIKGQRATAYVMDAGEPLDEIDLIDLSSQNIATDARYRWTPPSGEEHGVCEFQIGYQSVCLFGEPAEDPTWVTKKTMNRIQVLSDVFDGGDESIDGVTQFVFVACVEIGDTVDLVEGGDCDE
ncbi:MAG: hypothetical protein ACPGWS_07350, partial [Solirubrobacterales bacterium]